MLPAEDWFGMAELVCEEKYAVQTCVLLATCRLRMIWWFGRWCAIDTRLGPGAFVLGDETARAPAVDGDNQALIRNSDDKTARSFALDITRYPFPKAWNDLG